MARNRGTRARAARRRMGSTYESGVPRQYQFAMPRFPGVGAKPHYRMQAQADTDLAYQSYADKIASAQRQLADTKNEDLARAADIWDRYQKSIAPIGGTLAGANTAITNQLTGALGNLYGQVPTGSGITAENDLGQVAAATGGTGQLGILANAAAAQQGMQAGYQREGAVDAADMGRNIIADTEARQGELANQLADYARSMPDQFMQRLTQLRQQGQSDAMARFQLAMEYRQMLSGLASDQAYREMMQEWQAKQQAQREGGKEVAQGVRDVGAWAQGIGSGVAGAFSDGLGGARRPNGGLSGMPGPGMPPPPGARAGAFNAQEGQDRVQRDQIRRLAGAVVTHPQMLVQLKNLTDPAIRNTIFQQAGLTLAERTAFMDRTNPNPTDLQRAVTALRRWAQTYGS